MKFSLILVAFIFIASSVFADVTFTVRRFQNQGDGTAKLKHTEEYIFSENPTAPGVEKLQKMRVTDIAQDGRIVLSNRQRVKLLGVDYVNYAAIENLLLPLINDVVWLAYDPQLIDSQGNILAYAFTKDKIFLNAEVIKRGWAYADNSHPCRFYDVLKSYETSTSQSTKI